MLNNPEGGNQMDFKKMTVYQIYPRSFMDANGDGFGDLQGIISKLDYIEKLGTDCIWLTPIYISPQRDNGYDVADYCSIDPRYGTMADFDELSAQCKKRGIAIMLDMVFNHTSADHKWFQQALAGDEKYRDYYIFKPSREGGEPPTNWVSKFGGNAWGKVGDEHYLHLFDVSQPDLNWENPALRREIYDIMGFWLAKGIRGFRFDVVNLISKPEVYEDDHIGDGRRFYTDGSRVHEYLKELNKETFGKYECITVGEMSSTSIENCIKYSNPAENELSMTFSFHHLKVDYKDGDKWSNIPFDFAELKRLLHTWQAEMAKGDGWNATFWCNHDQPRAVSRFGCDRKYHYQSATMLATVIHLMRGTPYVYQGEEIGMTNAYFDKLSDYMDVESINYIEILRAEGKGDNEILAVLAAKSRDNARTPMQWDNTVSAGFSTSQPWLSVAKNYESINAASALENRNSIFYYYRELINLRKTLDIIAYGSYRPMWQEHSGVLAYMREYGDERLLVICNFYTDEQTVDISEFKDFDNLIMNYDELQIDGDMLKLRGYEAVAMWV